MIIFCDITEFSNTIIGSFSEPSEFAATNKYTITLSSAIFSNTTLCRFERNVWVSRKSLKVNAKVDDDRNKTKTLL